MLRVIDLTTLSGAYAARLFADDVADVGAPGVDNRRFTRDRHVFGDAGGAHLHVDRLHLSDLDLDVRNRLGFKPWQRRRQYWRAGSC